MSEKKVISLAKLQLGLKYFAALENGDETAFSKLLAIYNAPDEAAIWQLRNNPEQLEMLEKTIASKDSDEAAEDIAFFMEAVFRFYKKVKGVVPKEVAQLVTKR